MVLQVGRNCGHKTIVHKNLNPKTCYYGERGTWRRANKTCETYEVLELLCFAIKQTANRTWTLHSGCTPESGGTQICQYRNMPGPSASLGHGHPPTSLKFDQLRVEVRLSSDPFITAAKITRGSLEFGPTQQEEIQSSCMLLSVAFVLALPCAMLCLAAHRDMKNFKSLTGSKQTTNSDYVFQLCHGSALRLFYPERYQFSSKVHFEDGL